MSRNFTREQILAEIQRRKAMQNKNQGGIQLPNIDDEEFKREDRKLPRQSQLPPSRLPDASTSPPHKRQPPPNRKNTDEAYGVDKKTGKRYKKLLPQSKDVGATISSLLEKGVIDEEIESDNLNLSADVFLSHLRVAPDRKEMERLREEKARLRREQNEEYRKMLETTEEE